MKNTASRENQQSCPMCGGSDLTVSTQTDHFSFGEDDKAVELSAEIMAYHCEECDFSFSGEDASDARHEAVCRHLQLLTPKEIRAIRDNIGMSRAEFSRMTRIGEASLARWEKGLKFQNPAYDNLLYLISVASNLDLLAKRDFGSPIPASTADRNPEMRRSETSAEPVGCTSELRLYDPNGDNAASPGEFELWPTGT